MALIKFIDGKNKDVRGLIKAIDYIADEDKTENFIFKDSGQGDREDVEENSKNESWQKKLFLAAKGTMNISKDREEFIENMNKLGYQVKWENTRKYITFITPEGKVRRNDKLYPTENFTKEAMERKFKVNKESFEKGIELKAGTNKEDANEKPLSESDKEMIFVEKLISEDKVNRAINYITKDEKTSQHLITGINCNAESAFDEMMLTKKMFRKKPGREFVHFVHSFHPNEDISPELAHEISLKLIEQERFKSFEILVATHTDKDHIHTHFILNTTNIETGKKWQQSRKELRELKIYSNKLCEEYGLKYSFPNTGKGKKKSESIGEYKAREEGRSWKQELQFAVKNTLKYSTNREEFIENMNKLGYQVKWEDTRKYITFTTPNGRPCRNNKLYPPENFTKEALEKRFSINRQFAEMKETYENKRQLEEKQDLLIEAIKKLSYDPPTENAKHYPLTYLEGQALKEKIKEKEKGEGLDWER